MPGMNPAPLTYHDLHCLGALVGGPLLIGRKVCPHDGKPAYATLIGSVSLAALERHEAEARREVRRRQAAAAAEVGL